MEDQASEQMQGNTHIGGDSGGGSGGARGGKRARESVSLCYVGIGSVYMSMSHLPEHGQ